MSAARSLAPLPEGSSLAHLAYFILGDSDPADQQEASAEAAIMTKPPDVTWGLVRGNVARSLLARLTAVYEPALLPRPAGWGDNGIGQAKQSAAAAGAAGDTSDLAPAMYRLMASLTKAVNQVLSGSKLGHGRYARSGGLERVVDHTGQ